MIFEGKYNIFGVLSTEIKSKLLWVSGGRVVYMTELRLLIAF